MGWLIEGEDKGHKQGGSEVNEKERMEEGVDEHAKCLRTNEGKGVVYVGMEGTERTEEALGWSKGRRKLWCGRWDREDGGSFGVVKETG